MNCCDDYGQCKQGHGCPVRATPVPTPKQCLKAGACQSETDACPCDSKMIKNYNRMTMCVQVLLLIVVIGFAAMVFYRHPELLSSFF